jgi:Rrf2 family protein
MLRFSKKVEYALIVMADMSADISPEKLSSAKSLAEQYQIPQEILGKVLQTLVRRGLLISVQGVKGGYTLARDPNEINLKDIVEAVDGPVALMNCGENDHSQCGQFTNCNIKSPLGIIQTQLSMFFHSITLKDLRRNVHDISIQ